MCGLLYVSTSCWNIFFRMVIIKDFTEGYPIGGGLQGSRFTGLHSFSFNLAESSGSLSAFFEPGWDFMVDSSFLGLSLHTLSSLPLLQ